MFSPSWGFESTKHISQLFQGSLLPTTTGNSHTVDDYAFHQTWHHSVTPQNFSGYNPHCSDVWYGDNPLIEGLGNVDVGSDIIEEHSKVTSSTEVLPWKPHLALPPVSEVLNTSYGNLKWQNGSISPVERVSGDETCQLRFQPSTVPAKPEKSKKRTETKARTQTPRKLKKNKSALEGKMQKKRKRKPKTLQKKQKERERKIRTDQQHDAALKNSEDSSSPCSTPEITEPISEFGCHGSVEREESSAKSLQNGNSETPVNHIKRPMNAFLLYSQKYRRALTVMYPGRGNREISTLLGERWRNMKPEQKEQYMEKARELMRKTKESHPDFKYRYCKAREETGIVTASADSNKQADLDEGYRTGSHILRQRRSAIYTFTSGKGLEPALKKIRCVPGYQPNIKEMAVSEMTDSAGIVAATAFEPELSGQLVKPSIIQNKDTSPPCKEKIQESSPGGLSVEVNVVWCPSTADSWVQYDDNRKWHMLPDESDTANLPDKWFCSQHNEC